MANLLPHDTTAERALLGALMVDSSTLDNVMSIVTSDDFFHPAHRAIFQAIVKLDRQDKAVTPRAVYAEMRRTGDDRLLPQAGGGLVV